MALFLECVHLTKCWTLFKDIQAPYTKAVKRQVTRGKENLENQNNFAVPDGEVPY